MKVILNKIGAIIKKIYACSIVFCLFSGGITFFGYILALCIGGNVAEQICIFIYKSLIPIIIYISSTTVLLGLLSMYLCGETALTVDKSKKKQKQ